MNCAAFASAIDDAALGMAPSHALAVHLETCDDCAALLERRRVLARRIDGAVAVSVYAELPVGVAERISARVPSPMRHRWSPGWRFASAIVASALALPLLVVAHAMMPSGHATGLADLSAWRSPTDSLLISRGGVLETPFTLRGARARMTRVRS